MTGSFLMERTTPKKMNHCLQHSAFFSAILNETVKRPPMTDNWPLYLPYHYQKLANLAAFDPHSLFTLLR